MDKERQSAEDVLKAIDLALTGLLRMVDPKDLPAVSEALCNALVELNPNLILDKKDDKNGKV